MGLGSGLTQYTQFGSNMVCLARVTFILAAVLYNAEDSVSVKMEQNGYELTVAIHKDTPENLEIITQLQNMLTSASEYMYLATRKYLYIRHVKIMVPDTWNRNPAWRLEEEITFKEADIRVDSPHPAQGDIPYTFQPGQCGESGRYIHLTPDFVLDRGINRDFNYGDAGRVLVHEFAHLRFGVFDEYGVRGSSEHPVYYIDDKSAILQPTACSREINGHFVDLVNDLSCESRDGSKKLLSDNCDFLVDDYSNKATASVMYAQFLEKVTDFCETNPVDIKLKHNADAPNRHNKMCNEKGTWDVIREHPDVSLSSPAPSVTNRSPTFEVIYRQARNVGSSKVCGRRFVFVLDLSGSMQQNLRYYKLRQMADKTIRDILPEGTEVGIVVFSNFATVWTNMTFLTSLSDRETLAKGLPILNNFGGSTAIGLGLLKALELLEDGSKSADKARIFLISDGAENTGPKVASVMSTIVKKGVVVHTLAYSDAAANVLQVLSTNTGGQYSFFDESVSSSQLDSAGQRLLSDVSVCDEEDDSQEIDRRAVQLTSTNTALERPVLIDSTVGNNTLFVFTLSKDATTEITLTDPSGNVYNADSPYYSKDSTLNIIRFLIPLAQSGRWKYNLKKGSALDESVVAVVKSHPRVGSLPFEVETWTSANVYDYNNGSGVVVYTYVHQGYSPMIRAKVEATVSRPGVTPYTRTLKDDGKLPDNTANDGVYTNYLLGFRSNSRYSMEVRVESVDGDTVIIKSGNRFSGRTLTVYRNVTIPVLYEPVTNFRRTASPGAIDVQGYDPDVDQLDPSKVTDLELAISSTASKVVELTWTAPGDDLNSGTVTKYDIRMAESFDSLRQNFSTSYEIVDNITNVISGSLKPLPAGSQQQVGIKLPDNWKSDFFVFGLKSIDDGNRTSQISNLRSYTLKTISIPQRTTTTTTSTPTTKVTATDNDNTTVPSRAPETVLVKTSTNLSTFIIGTGMSLGIAVNIIVMIIVCKMCVFPGAPRKKNVQRRVYVLPVSSYHDRLYP